MWGGGKDVGWWWTCEVVVDMWGGGKDVGWLTCGSISGSSVDDMV